jgi:hypothetical protein
MPRRNDAAEVLAHDLATNPLIFKCLPPELRFLGAAGNRKADDLMAVGVRHLTLRIGT